jgi:hypothetical protein
MQTDWGGEYQKLNSFFQRVGISHLVSCPHAHQQNGPSERKHRHIVEVGLSLLAYASMPLKYWDEAFLTTVYLINRLPNKVIQSQTPMERLFGNSGDYSLLRTFGCACWQNFRPYNRYKLAFRSKQCVFIGYSNLHKGYKCLDISTGRLYISRDIVFDETVFPFAALHSNAGARLRAEIELLPLSLHPVNLHHHEGHGLHEAPVDVDPANATNTVAESFLQDADHIYTSDDDSSHFSVPSTDPKLASGDRTSSQLFGADLCSSGSRMSVRACSSNSRGPVQHDGVSSSDSRGSTDSRIVARGGVQTDGNSGSLSATPGGLPGSSASSSTSTGKSTGSSVPTASGFSEDQAPFLESSIGSGVTAPRAVIPVSLDRPLIRLKRIYNF